MQNDMVAKLAMLLIEHSLAQTMPQALNTVINSETYQLITDPDTHLYYQSPRYVFSFLQHEIKHVADNQQS